MKNPLLNGDQVSNHVNLNKNLIVTGPNAAGKTTYVKSIVANIVLAQTLGICMSREASISIYDVIRTFMRVSDELGQTSYFETEVKYCKNMIDKAIENNGKGRSLFILDEPMHSTPPIEGQSTAYAVLRYLAENFDNIDILITTHYHNLVCLEYEYPRLFKNVSMEANNIGYRRYNFKYKLKNGFSKQCIAIELLDREMFPKEIIDNACMFKDKICND